MFLMQTIHCYYVGRLSCDLLSCNSNQAEWKFDNTGDWRLDETGEWRLDETGDMMRVWTGDLQLIYRMF